MILFTHNIWAKGFSEKWWFVFVKESIISENRIHTKELFSAVKNSDIQAVASALDKGAFINARDSKGRTPLHWAVYMNNFEMAEFLLQQGADPNALNRRHRTPLHWAVLKPDIALTQLLLSYNADPNIRDKRKRAPLHWLVLKPNENIERLTLRKRTNKSSKEEAHPPLYWDESDLQKIELLLQYKADPNLKTIDNRTLVFLAVAQERLPVVKLLVQFGADVNLKDYVDDTSLHFLSKKRKITSLVLSMARFLLENGADPNALSLAKASPTHLAEFHHHTQLYNLFLEFGGQPKQYNACMRALKTLSSKVQSIRQKIFH